VYCARFYNSGCEIHAGVALEIEKESLSSWKDPSNMWKLAVLK